VIAVAARTRTLLSGSSRYREDLAGPGGAEVFILVAVQKGAVQVTSLLSSEYGI